MHKTLKLALNKYDSIPLTLRENPAVDSPRTTIEVNLASLYHHYFLDSYGIAPPDPDPAQFEHAQFLLPIDEFRFQGNGLGDTTSVRRHRSNELGQAFCRWFLYEHFGVTYFAHVEGLLRRQRHRRFDGCSLERIASGDTPDYLCATNSSACLAEAKGRYSAVTFGGVEFAKWRSQFDRVAFKDPSGTVKRLKGHIVAARFATEETVRVKTTLYGEDPVSPGERDFDEGSSTGLVQAARAAHFANIAEKLRQPVLASALTIGVPLPEQLRVSGVVWRVQSGPLEGFRFVGGYYGVGGVGAAIRQSSDGLEFGGADPLRLDLPQFTFFGIEEAVFRQVVAMARSQAANQIVIDQFRSTDFFYSGFSALRDGTVIGPLDFFAPIERLLL